MSLNFLSQISWQFQIIDDVSYTNDVEKKFIQNWRDRIGNEMEIEIIKVKDISTESSGKYRIVKNNIKHSLLI